MRQGEMSCETIRYFTGADFKDIGQFGGHSPPYENAQCYIGRTERGDCCFLDAGGLCPPNGQHQNKQPVS